ncbi:MAG TPA: rhodanese-related sulfurtransferase [Flavobacteriales bacterium]|nr:rhodanese-related sulfurtransferase [Flavobacteriales bacterium]
MALYNKYDKNTLRKKLEGENFKRTTVSFYRYVILDDLENRRNQLYTEWTGLGVLGRVYIAREGINAQISIPVHNVDAFTQWLNATHAFKNMPLKWAVENTTDPFLKLIVRVKQKIVADGLDDNSFDVTNVGTHLTAKEFNEAMEYNDTIVVDMRNHYESEVGKFIGAITPDADTFKEELPMVLEELKGKENQKILMYCTGGVRCEKASAYLKHHGFTDVNQLHGGIIDYVRQIKEQGLESKFIGKNFVFDQRLGERITNDIISVCHQCGKPCDNHTNCANDDCHLLFIQCDACKALMKNCCTHKCMDVIALPPAEQKKLRRGERKLHSHAVYKSRLRPDLKQILKSEKTGDKT